jgi:integrase
MGSIYTRGTRARPRFYLYYREGTNPDGSPRYVQRAAKGAKNKGDARKMLVEAEARVGRGESGQVSVGVVARMEPLLTEWRDSLTNRSAYQDRKVIDRDLIPTFRGKTIAQVDLPVVMRWIDQLAKTNMASQTQRHRLTLLSRFFSWAIERGLASVNPCRMIPKGKRPSAKRQKEIPWLEDDAKIPAIMSGLGHDLGLVFYLARFSGLREGEAAGLRISDMDFLNEGLVRVRYSFDGELKESKDGSKPVKWAPAPIDAADVLGLYVKRRKLQGARDDDVVFPYIRPEKTNGRIRTSSWKQWAGWHPKMIRTVWRNVADDLALPKALTFYGASRHTFVTKALKAGASLDEVSAAIGHADPTTTKRFYDHFVRKTFSPTLRQGLSGALAAQTAGTGVGGPPVRRG